MWAESLRVGWSQPVATAVTALIVAAVCGVIVSTTGQTVAIERDVLSRIDDAGTRTIVVEDVQGRGDLRPGAIDRLRALAHVDWAVGFGLTTDVRPAGIPGAEAVPLRPVFGALPSQVHTDGAPLSAGRALAGVDAIGPLGFASPAGPVQPASDHATELAVVGWFEASAPLSFLNRSLLTVPTADEPVLRIVILADAARSVPDLSELVRDVLDPVDPTSVSITTSDTLVSVRAAIQGTLGTFGRAIVGGVLLAGLVLTGLNVFGAVTARRRDFGRRRALGASRLDIIGMVLVQTTATGIGGAIVGSAVGVLVVQSAVGTAPSPDFIAAVAVLAVLATAVAALIPAAIAAFRDPVRVLRVP